MLVCQMRTPQEQFNKSITASITIGCLVSKSISTNRRRQPGERIMNPKKRSKLSNAAAPLNGVVIKILFLGNKGPSVNQKLEVTLGFVKLNGVRYAAFYVTVTFMRW